MIQTDPMIDENSNINEPISLILPQPNNYNQDQFI